MPHHPGMFAFLLLLAVVGFYRMGAAAEQIGDAGKDRSSEAVDALLESIQQLLANPDAIAEAREELNRQGERLKEDQTQRLERVEDLTSRFGDIKQSAGQMQTNSSHELGCGGNSQIPRFASVNNLF